MTREERIERARKAGLANVAKHGREHMARIGSLGFWATVNALAERQNIPVDLNYNPFRNLLRNLVARKNGRH